MLLAARCRAMGSEPERSRLVRICRPNLLRSGARRCDVGGCVRRGQDWERIAKCVTRPTSGRKETVSMNETNAEKAEHLAEMAKSGGPGIRHDTRALVYALLAIADAVRAAGTVAPRQGDRT